MSYSFRISNSFERQLRKLSETNRERIWRLLREIEVSPYSFKPMSGQMVGTHSARIGDLRVAYAVDE